MATYQNKIKRRTTRQVQVGDVLIGGLASISVQSMTNTLTTDVTATVDQIARLARAGCDLMRVSVPDMDSVTAFQEIRAQSSVPLVADIHFDYRLAVAVSKYADKLRINPGNIGGKDRIREVIKACQEHGIPIRVGVNGGSLPKDLYQQYGLCPESLVQAALRHIELLDEF